MSWGLIGAVFGIAILAISVPILVDRKYLSRRFEIIGFIITIAGLPMALGAAWDSQISAWESAEQERRASARARSMQAEQRREEEFTRRAITLAVAEIIAAMREPAGPRRASALRSALSSFDRAAARLSPGSSHQPSLAALVPPAAASVPDRTVPSRPAYSEGAPNQVRPMPDTITPVLTAPAVVAPNTSATSTIPSTVFIPPPVVMIPPVIMMPPPPPPAATPF